MADKPSESKRPPDPKETSPAEPKKGKKSKIKVIAAVAVLMLGEAGALVVVLRLGGPAKSEASTRPPT
jgi:hypothetical protein